MQRSLLYTCSMCSAPLGNRVIADDSDIDEANHGMLVAAEAGNEFIVWLLFFWGANNFNIGLNTAARRGYESIAKLMIA